MHKCTYESLKEMKLCVRVCEGETEGERECVSMCARMYKCGVCVFVHSLGWYPTIAISGSPDSASIMTPLVTNPYWCTHKRTHKVKYTHTHTHTEHQMDASSH